MPTAPRTTKSTFSVTPPVLFHLRSNWSMYQDTTSAFEVNRLCSTWALADEAVQLDDPKMTMLWSPAVFPFWSYRMTDF